MPKCIDTKQIDRKVQKNNFEIYFFNAAPMQVWSDCSISFIILSCSLVSSSFRSAFRLFFACSSGDSSISIRSFFREAGVECGELDARDETTKQLSLYIILGTLIYHPNFKNVLDADRIDGCESRRYSIAPDVTVTSSIE